MSHHRHRVNAFWICGIATFCIVASWVLLTSEKQNTTAATPDHVIPVTLLNAWGSDYVWIHRNVRASVWVARADASNNPIANFTGVLELPDNPLGNGFQVPEHQIAQGHVTFPSDFDIQRHINAGNEIKISVYAVPRGIYTADSPFKPGPQMSIGNAFGQLFLSQSGLPDTLLLVYER